ncbi:MAG: sugar transferase [Candidatus Omnitrophota bacterium]|nr:sugar transferase [Candidatus Omnitrophota bacterium]
MLVTNDVRYVYEKSMVKVGIEIPYQKRLAIFSKRTIDVLLAIFLLFLLWPLFILVSILITLDSPGPVIFKHKRIGRNNKEFLLCKFRTMDKDTFPYIFKLKKQDPRITKVGNFLRNTGLDELPQIWNVLKGDMSFVGPRPEIPYFSELFSRNIDNWSLRLKVKPGLTGLAQLAELRNGSPAELTQLINRLEQDLNYINNHSLIMDIRILFFTVAYILKKIYQNMNRRKPLSL